MKVLSVKKVNYGIWRSNMNNDDEVFPTCSPRAVVTKGTHRDRTCDYMKTVRFAPSVLSSVEST